MLNKTRPCQLNAIKNYRKRNPERMFNQNHKYYLENKETIKIYHQKLYLLKKELKTFMAIDIF